MELNTYLLDKLGWLKLYISSLDHINFIDNQSQLEKELISFLLYKENIGFIKPNGNIFFIKWEKDKKIYPMYKNRKRKEDKKYELIVVEINDKNDYIDYSKINIESNQQLLKLILKEELYNNMYKRNFKIRKLID